MLSIETSIGLRLGAKRRTTARIKPAAKPAVFPPVAAYPPPRLAETKVATVMSTPIDKKATSPRITHVSWGRMEVDGLGSGRDFKLWPGGGREWDWNETDTHHVPGTQVSDVEELVEHGSKVVVLTRGMELVLQTSLETLDYLQDKGITVHVDETNAAVALYNKLAETQAVGGLFHSTC
jgi:hypothetical protein